MRRRKGYGELDVYRVFAENVMMFGGFVDQVLLSFEEMRWEENCGPEECKEVI
jgi:hypothetical protein